MEKKQKFIWDILFYGMIIVLIWAACKFVLPVLIPFIIAFVIASLIRIPIKKLYGPSEVKNRIISITVCILFYGVVFFVLGFASARIYRTISDFLISVPGLYQDDVVPALNQVSDIMNRALQSMDEGIAVELDKMFQNFLGNIGEYIKNFSVNAIKVISGSLAGIPGFIIKLVITIISTFFCIVDYNKILVLGIRFIPRGKEETFLNVLRYFKGTIFIYAKSYFLLFLLTYVELAIGFTILRIPYAPLIAALIALFDILPILGVGGVLLPWFVVLLVMKNIPKAIGMILLYLVITFVRQTAEPKLVGKQIGLHPLATLIFMYLGLKFMGIVGMFLFPVTLAVLINMKREKES